MQTHGCGGHHVGTFDHDRLSAITVASDVIVLVKKEPCNLTASGSGDIGTRFTVIEVVSDSVCSHTRHNIFCRDY